MKTQNQYLNYLIGPSFQGANRFFVLKFEDNTLGKEGTRYFLPNVESKSYNLLIAKRNDFDQPGSEI